MKNSFLGLFSIFLIVALKTTEIYPRKQSIFITNSEKKKCFQQQKTALGTVTKHALCFLFCFSLFSCQTNSVFEYLVLIITVKCFNLKSR